MSKKNYPLIFIVEDNLAYSKVLERHLIAYNYANIVKFITGEECLNNLYRKPNIIIQDYKLQGISGLNVLQRTKKVLPQTEFIFLSTLSDIDIAINTIKAGAYCYISKNNNELNKLIQKIDEITVFQVLNNNRKKKKKRYLIILFALIISAISALIITNIP